MLQRSLEPCNAMRYGYLTRISHVTKLRGRRRKTRQPLLCGKRAVPPQKRRGKRCCMLYNIKGNLLAIQVGSTRRVDMHRASTHPESTTPPDFTAAIALKRTAELPEDMAERIAELLVVCRDAAAFEHFRRQAGQPPVEQAPWPSSTIEFMRTAARKFHERPSDQ